MGITLTGFSYLYRYFVDKDDNETTQQLIDLLSNPRESGNTLASLKSTLEAEGYEAFIYSGFNCHLGTLRERGIDVIESIRTGELPVLIDKISELAALHFKGKNVKEVLVEEVQRQRDIDDNAYQGDGLIGVYQLATDRFASSHLPLSIKHDLSLSKWKKWVTCLILSFSDQNGPTKEEGLVALKEFIAKLSSNKHLLRHLHRARPELDLFLLFAANITEDNQIQFYDYLKYSMRFHYEGFYPGALVITPEDWQKFLNERMALGSAHQSAQFSEPADQKS